MITRYDNYIKENNEQILDRLKEICQDSIQEIVDLDIDNFKEITTSWEEYWDTRNGWYDIEGYISKDFYSPVVVLKLTFRISKYFSISQEEIIKKLNGVLHRFDRIGFISNLATTDVSTTSVAYGIEIEFLSKRNHIKL